MPPPAWRDPLYKNRRDKHLSALNSPCRAGGKCRTDTPSKAEPCRLHVATDAVRGLDLLEFAYNYYRVSARQTSACGQNLVPGPSGESFYGALVMSVSPAN